ncbi:hypothetical protein PB1_02640 [Bacillus methanolicus PB1]|uniref:Uncharacterized protein n=1 Tax=Bacillus methanolicus PB1 TaxID=997296 RepID=I3E5N0_BACMT|nr:hypothetical protein [Bacillus methanolicus]EIJ81801.1 hypothetical protein PB1_02640 [Bacillus methanolicus PB1]
MSIKNLKILNNKGSIDIPDWINFAFELGAYINDNGIRYKKAIGIILSLPSEHFFSLLIAMGIADKTFSINKQMRSIRKTVLSLTKGSRIIYKDEQSSRKASVISVEPSPVFENEMILKIKDGKIERGIPERQWIDRVILLDEEFNEIKRTRKVSNKQKVGLDSSPLLRVLYSSSQLNKVEFYPGDYFYIVGNITQVNESMREEIFIYNGVRGSIADFLYMDNSNSYTNGKLFSSQMKKNEGEIREGVPVIFSDLNSYLKQAKNFPKNPKIIVSSRTDNENRIHEVKEELKRKFLQNEYRIVTKEIVDYLNSTDTQIPNGVEFLAWR